MTTPGTSTIMTVTSAMTSGVNRSGILEKISIGEVAPRGPETKLAMTRKRQCQR